MFAQKIRTNAGRIFWAKLNNSRELFNANHQLLCRSSLTDDAFVFFFHDAEVH